MRLKKVYVDWATSFGKASTQELCPKAVQYQEGQIIMGPDNPKGEVHLKNIRERMQEVDQRKKGHRQTECHVVG